MKIIILTQIGDSISSNPNNNNTTAYRVLSYLRRHGKQATDSQICDHLGLDGTQLRVAVAELEKAQAVKTVVSA